MPFTGLFPPHILKANPRSSKPLGLRTHLETLDAVQGPQAAPSCASKMGSKNMGNMSFSLGHVC